MNCEAKFLDALGVELQRLSSLRLVWCRSSGQVWCSAGMRKRFGLTATYFDELAGWGLIHPDDHARVLEALEALDASPEPALARGLRMLLAPGVWSEFDVVYGRLGCGGVFGSLPAPCWRCGLLMVSMLEHVAGKWVEAVDVLEGEEGERLEAEAEAVATVQAVDAVEAEEDQAPAGETVEGAPTGREQAVARDALAEEWRRFDEVLARARAVGRSCQLEPSNSVRRARVAAAIRLLSLAERQAVGVGVLVSVALLGLAVVLGLVFLISEALVDM